MPVFMIISFKVKENRLETARKVIREFVSQVQKHEPETEMYESLYEIESPLQFHHIMKFKNKAAQEYHRDTPYVKKFVAELYPILEAEPKFIPMESLSPGKQY